MYDRFAIIIISMAAWIWLGYTIIDNHILLSIVQYTLYTLGILFLAKKLGKQILAFFIISAIIGLVYEITGTRTGLPFGKYEYNQVLSSSLGVPWFIAFMWGLLSLIVLLAAAPALKRKGLAIAVAPIMLVALDLSIDPIMVELGLWRWVEGGPWYGVPLTNFVGWYVVGLSVFVLSRILLGRGFPNIEGWNRWYVIPYLSHMLAYGIAAPLEAFLASIFTGFGILVVLLRVFAM